MEIDNYITDSPVLFITFNRIEQTKKVFESIKRAKPKKLYIASDGPRNDVKDEKKKVLFIRNYLQDNISWDCDLKTLYKEHNTGCKKAVSSAINWFFSKESQGIILEDDCLPSSSFFRFCDELLERYKNDLRIWNIGGYKPLKIQVNSASYEFSEFSHIWGWASWADRWDKFDLNIPKLEEFSKQKRKIFTINRINLQRMEELKNLHEWGNQWNFCIRSNNGLSIRPHKNLVHNIGYGEGGTHTNFLDKDVIENNCFEIPFPLKHPEFISVACNNDLKYSREISNSFFNRVLRYLKRKLYESKA